MPRCFSSSRRVLLCASLATLGLGASACSSKDSTAPSALTAADAAELLSVLAANQSAALAQRTTSTLPTFSVSSGLSLPCPNGGTIAVNQSVTTSGVSGTIAYAACKSTSTAGHVWTVDGTMNDVISITTSASSTTVSSTYSGNLSFSSSHGKAGSCPINFTANATFDATLTHGSVSVNGSVCGQTTSVTQTF